MLAVLGAAVAFAALLVIVTSKHRRSVLALLVGASAGLMAVQVFQIHLFTFIVVAWAILSRRDGKEFGTWQAILTLVCAAPLAVTVLTGDLVNSPTLALQLLALAFCAAIIVATANREDITIMLYGLLAMASVGSAWGVLQVSGIAPNDVWHLDVSALGRPTGIYPEPDWLGMFAGLGLILSWRMDVSPRWRIALVSINGFALIFAFARAAWVAVAVSVVIGIFLSRRKAPKPGVHTGKGMALGVLAMGGVIALVTIPSLASDLSVRLSRTLTVADSDVSAQARVLQNDALNFLSQTAPWYGHGLSSSGRVTVSGRLDYGESVNNLGSNWILSMWVDGAFLALPLIALLLSVTFLCLRLIQGQLLLLVLANSFFSNATFQPIMWFLLALCLASFRIGSAEKALVGSMFSRRKEVQIT